jgi:predicted metal-dependent HD superfamily phosphohydrolase
MSAWLEAQWTELWPRLAARGDAAVLWATLRRAYSEPHRRYHTLQHLEHCLREFGAVRPLAQNPLSAELALWFHDVRYDTHAADNEEESARLADSALAGAGLPEDFRARVVGLILDTKHAKPPASPDGALVVDADLSILGQEPGRFAEFEQLRGRSPPESRLGLAAALTLPRFPT